MSNMQQMSSAVSDFVLALTSFGTAISLLRQNIFASAGFALMGAVASCGTYRFSRASPSPGVLQLHQAMAWVTTILGTSLVASGFHRRYDNSVMSAVHMGSALALICLSKVTDVLSMQTEEFLVSAVSSAAVVSIGVFSILHTNPFGILAAVLYGIAAAVGTTGELASILRVDWFHYLLAFANVVFLRAFTYASPHVYYKDN
ncbi:uncharacterized protein LOC110973749 isoform X2 [Acanthaster planci]|nr:uncharacterized protein LOC110973749 isoform X2 [Acanthaster planci]XP_022080503.1 uncharacterized protein LOC110973749 isoform X2 [Acanthaster planci]XP_022080504.1 uncharacterized protein LOC110973749 isoform X2 [Acanthaster planci]XP_022080505.1 uncharacterized protein LOC110973749 isoform X2 [Acanthaster planci]XP_022080506.1 uncharacterized protein LOC110973749 isoform X2 [Acanthaster planci]XP_022080507.1 uncharacterized protein LOC110973749 isoform X2 [Acanthaster planci]